MGKLTVSACKTQEGVEIPGLLIITPTVFRDDRGYFTETYCLRDLEEVGIRENFVQDNQSCSAKGVLRGLHFQKQYPQGKLVRMVQGSVFDVAVDLRKDSPTFGKWYGDILSGENFKQLYIPNGFAHGFLVLSETAVACYKQTEYYCPGDDFGIAWDDPFLNISWPVISGKNCLADGTRLCLSSKDRTWPGFQEYFEKHG